MFEPYAAGVVHRLEHLTEADRRVAEARVAGVVPILAGAARAAIRMIQLGDRIPARAGRATCATR